jgi:hypothetical protein
MTSHGYQTQLELSGYDAYNAGQEYLAAVRHLPTHSPEYRERESWAWAHLTRQLAEIDYRRRQMEEDRVQEIMLDGWRMISDVIAVWQRPGVRPDDVQRIDAGWAINRLMAREPDDPFWENADGDELVKRLERYVDDKLKARGSSYQQLIAAQP